MDRCCSDLQVNMVKVVDLSLAYNKDHGQLEQKYNADVLFPPKVEIKNH